MNFILRKGKETKHVYSDDWRIVVVDRNSPPVLQINEVFLQINQISFEGAKEIRIFNLDDDKWAQAVKNMETINKETDCVASVHYLEDKEDFKKSIAESDIYCDATNVGMNPLQDQTLVEDPS